MCNCTPSVFLSVSNRIGAEPKMTVTMVKQGEKNISNDHWKSTKIASFTLSFMEEGLFTMVIRLVELYRYIRGVEGVEKRAQSRSKIFEPKKLG